MIDLIVDAPLLACPRYSGGDDAQFQKSFFSYLARLAELSKLRSACGSIQFWIDQQLASALNDEGCYPFRHIIEREAAHFHHRSEFQLEDVIGLASALLGRSRQLEAYGDVKDIAVSECSVSNDSYAERPAAFRDHLCRELGLGLPILGDGNAFRATTYLASTADSDSPRYVSVNFLVDMVELADGTCREIGIRRNGKIETFRGAIFFFDGVDLIAAWAAGAETVGLDVLAVNASAGHSDPWSTLSRVRCAFAFGREFTDSARATGFMHERQKIEKLLRVIGDIAHQRNLANGHALRTGRGANDPQETRGKWKAWRRDIDYEFHLHYWQMGTRVELANIVTHEDFGITR